MKLLPRNLVLGVLVAALAVAHLTLEPARATRRDVLPLLPAFDATSLGSVRIVGAAGTTTLVRDGTDGSFVVQEKFGAPAREGQVVALLAALAAMTDLDVVGEGADARSRRDLDGAEATTVELVARDGSATVVRAVPGEGGAAFVAVDGDPRVVRVPRFRPPSADPRTWFESYLLVPNARRNLAELRIRGGGLAEEVVVRARRGDLTAYEDETGAPLDDGAVDELVRTLRSVTALDVVARPAEGAAEQLGLDVAALDGTKFHITVTDLGGAAPDAGDGGIRPGIAFRSDMEFGVEVSPEWIARLLVAAGRF